ncbi:MAG: hypothetical protein KatS3mg077_0535 [Candidatus Binatia bacterium]|nr:MAG: hypothetical protein KatS3mg077_0535 [Candidatus Binatia bacterium]
MHPWPARVREVCREMVACLRGCFLLKIGPAYAARPRCLDDGAFAVLRTGSGRDLRLA